jgi:hypothetical protein
MFEFMDIFAFRIGHFGPWAIFMGNVVNPTEFLQLILGVPDLDKKIYSITNFPSLFVIVKSWHSAF